ncbi:cytochrome C biogenesis protein [Actinobacillus genomosp. 2]|uniref:TPR domain-containing protein n=1 Tax=Actinobacillus genomosp. 2 TaxID=230709 RepID=UPI0024413310|nr:cytochrome C biogenesis protein [Actinobacillus genomosp. 2]WGE32844.1 cytochrome C biogenesis protein [Actinobacillus genomosp. 2]
MKTRDQFNQQNYQQAVKFAESYSVDLKQEYLAETQDRYQFEQMQKSHRLENITQKRPLATLGLLVLLGVVTTLIYWQTDRYQIVRTGTQMHQAFQVQTALEDKEQKNYRYITNLQDRLRENPNNGDLWYELGQAYALNNDFDSALVCYDNAQKVLGEKASILGAMATAEYYANHKNLSEKAQQWIDKALKVDAKESSSLLLLASDAYAKKNYQQAIDFWRKVLDSDNDAIDRKAIIYSIQTAKEMLN